MANSLATVGGTVAFLTGVFAGGTIVDAMDATTPVVIAGMVGWLVASWIASRITSDLHPRMRPERPELLRHELRRVTFEFGDGLRTLLRTRRAIGPITSITIDQIGQGLLVTISLVVFRDQFGGGVASFSNLVGAGGVGVLLGVLTVGKLEERLTKPTIIGGAFVVGGVIVLGTSASITDWSVLLASFSVGLTFAWKKISVDTMVQQAIPDGYRGRVFSVYDVVYNLARVVAAALAIPMIPRLGVDGSLAAVGIVFLLWAPVVRLWFGRAPELTIRFYAGGRADETPRSIVWGGVEEPVELIRTWRDERDGERRLAFRLALEDGTLLDVSRAEPDGAWRLDREDDRASRRRIDAYRVRRTERARLLMDERSKRNALTIGAIALALLSVVAGALIALSDDAEPVAAPSPTPERDRHGRAEQDPRSPPRPRSHPDPSRRSSRTAITSCT